MLVDMRESSLYPGRDGDGEACFDNPASAIGFPTLSHTACLLNSPYSRVPVCIVFDWGTSWLVSKLEADLSTCTY